MRGCNQRPYFPTRKEAEWFEKTPKRVIFAIMRDFAHIMIGIEECDKNPPKVLEFIRETEAIIKNAKLDKG